MSDIQILLLEECDLSWDLVEEGKLSYVIWYVRLRRVVEVEIYSEEEEHTDGNLKVYTEDND